MDGHKLDTRNIFTAPICISNRKILYVHRCTVCISLSRYTYSYVWCLQEFALTVKLNSPIIFHTIDLKRHFVSNPQECHAEKETFCIILVVVVPFPWSSINPSLLVLFLPLLFICHQQPPSPPPPLDVVPHVLCESWAALPSPPPPLSLSAASRSCSHYIILTTKSQVSLQNITTDFNRDVERERETREKWCLTNSVCVPRSFSRLQNSLLHDMWNCMTLEHFLFLLSLCLSFPLLILILICPS